MRRQILSLRDGLLNRPYQGNNKPGGGPPPDPSERGRFGEQIALGGAVWRGGHPPRKLLHKSFAESYVMAGASLHNFCVTTATMFPPESLHVMADPFVYTF